MKTELIRRYIVFFIGISILSLGVGIITKGNLGTSPITSIPYSLSMIFSLSIGEFTILYSFLLVTIQGVLLWKFMDRTSKFNLAMEYVFCVVFGYLVDLFMAVLEPLNPTDYWLQVVTVLVGILVLAFGVYLQVVAGAIMAPGDGFAYAITLRTRWSYGKVRVISDSSMVIVAAVIGLIGLGTLGGVREGTVLCCILTGLTSKQYMKHFGKLTSLLVPGENLDEIADGEQKHHEHAQGRGGHAGRPHADDRRQGREEGPGRERRDPRPDVLAGGRAGSCREEPWVQHRRPRLGAGRVAPVGVRPGRQDEGGRPGGDRGVRIGRAGPDDPRHAPRGGSLRRVRGDGGRRQRPPAGGALRGRPGGPRVAAGARHREPPQQFRAILAPRVRYPFNWVKPCGGDSMQIGIVGKPNVGKSTFFGAATMAPVEIANYPFTTIEPNKGVAYVRTPCPCRELGVTCTPHNSLCVNGTRMVPVELLDVAGLVPDAWQGKGLGNKFLDDLRQADALINVVDASGGTDIEGNPVKPGTHDPAEDILFLRTEIECWMREIIKNGFAKIARQAKMQGSKPEAILAERLQGLKVTEAQIKDALREVPLPEDPTKWDDDVLLRLCGAIRERSKPMIAAMNKADIAPPENLERIREVNPQCVPTMAETELALKKAASTGLVEYNAGDPSFKIKEGAKVSDNQRKALDYMADNMGRNGGTGVQQCIEEAAFGMLDLICVYPVEDETKYTDHFGRVLPDAFLLPRGSTARDLAYRVHTDLGDKFIRAVNAKTKRTVGADYELQDGDVIRIVANK